MPDNIVKFPGRRERKRDANLRRACRFNNGFEFMNHVEALSSSERDGLAAKLRQIADYLDAMYGAKP